MITLEDRARLVKRADGIHTTDKAAMLIVLDATGEFQVATFGDPISMGFLREQAIKLLKGGVQ